MLTVLSQHTSDLNAERAFASLREAFPRGTTWWRRRPPPWPTRSARGGLADTKAPRIQAILRAVHDREGRLDLSRLRDVSDEEARAYLTSLPGVGPKTAAVVLSFALGRDAIPVDTHVHRVSKRLGLIPANASAEKRRPVAPRPGARRSADAAARRIDPAGPGDLQGADSAAAGSAR